MKNRKILIDVDDTLIQSSKKVIEILNAKNGTNYVLDDLSSFDYSNLDNSITQKDVIEIYGMPDFYKNIEFSQGAIKFMVKYQNDFDMILITRGDYNNLQHKNEWFNECKKIYGWNNTSMISLPLESDKSEIILDNVYLAIDNQSDLLDKTNSPSKILFKNNQDVYWNKEIPNKNWYVVNNWNQIIEMVDFDMKLFKEGIIIG